jgi:TolA-binding protein
VPQGDAAAAGPQNGTRRETQSSGRRLFGFLGRNPRFRSGLIAAAAALILCCVGLFIFIIPSMRYGKAMKLLDSGEYLAAYEIFSRIDYSDSSEKALESYYLYAAALLDNGAFLEAAEAFGSLGDYSDSAQQITRRQPRYSDPSPNTRTAKRNTTNVCTSMRWL